MNVYICHDDLYCEDCGNEIRNHVSRTNPRPAKEWQNDSDVYPQGPYPNGGGEADLPQHCAAGENCLVAFHCSDGTKIGVWLENELTEEGVTYVKEAVKEGGYVANLWFEWYLDLGYIL